MPTLTPVTLRLIPVEYRDGLVIALIARPAIETRQLHARNAQEIWDACARLHADYNGTHDGKVAVYLGDARKPAGFDKIVKANLWKLECKRNPVWDAVK